MIRLILFACLALAAILVVSTELSNDDHFGQSNRPRLAMQHNDLAEHYSAHIRHHG